MHTSVIWRAGSQVARVLEIANDFNQKNPYGIKAELEQAGTSHDDVYNKINASIQGGGDWVGRRSVRWKRCTSTRIC